MVKRKICVFTGTRAEYGLLKPLLTQLKRTKNIQLQLLVSGMHLSKEYGLTYKEIEKDGFKIDRKVDIELNSNSSVGVSRSTGLGMMRYAKALTQLKPDLLVVLGDRFEAFAVSTAATICQIPIAHLHGGEATFGLIDEAIRHSISKMSQLHFTSTDAYRKRVVQLGENPNRVFNVGAIGLDNIKTEKLYSRTELQKELGVVFRETNVIVTFHPVTLEPDISRKQFQELLSALDKLKDVLIIFTKANADPGGKTVNQMIDRYVRKHPGRSAAFASLGQRRYLSCLKVVDAVIGNSSSGIIEAPSFKVPTVNIGERQAGRLQAKSVINCKPNKRDIFKAIHKALSKSFSTRLKSIQNPYGDGKTANRIKKVLTKYPLDNMLIKPFYDLKVNHGKK